MTNSKSTKSSLLISSISLLLCFAMLLGTTFAWFTDSAVSASNVITSGNLDIDVQYTLGDKDASGEFVWNKLDGAKDLFQKGLWEPGHTEVVALKIENKGSLALKYTANMNIIEETSGKTKEDKDIVLSDILTVASKKSDAVADVTTAFEGENALTYDKTALFKSTDVLGTKNSEIVEKNKVEYVIIKVDMADTVGNEANHDGKNIPQIEFGINVIATQYTFEEDSFGNEYDKDAQYPEVSKMIKVEGNDKAAVIDAINNAKPGDVVRLNEDTTIAGYNANYKLVIDKDVVLDLNGKTLTTESGWGGIDLKGGASIINGTINHTGNTAAIKAFQVEKIENVTINVTETTGKTKGGIVVQNGNSYVGSIKNVTINGATNGIECYRSTNEKAIVSMENVTINAIDNGIYINGAGNIGSIFNCQINGGNIGINAYLANLWHISLDIKNSTITGGTSGIDIWDEAATNTGSTVTFNYDNATTFTGSTNDIKVTLQEEISCMINGEKQAAPCNIYIKK